MQAVNHVIWPIHGDSNLIFPLKEERIDINYTEAKKRKKEKAGKNKK